MPIHMEYPELRDAALEAEARFMVARSIELTKYKPNTRDVASMLAPPGSITIFLARKDSKIIEEIRSAAQGDGSEEELVRRLVKHFKSRKRTSIEKATEMLRSEPAFAEIRHGGTTVAASLFHPEGLECCVVVLPYNGGRLVRGGLTLIERFAMPNPDDPEPGDRPPVIPPIGPDPAPFFEVLALVHPPKLSRAEREALAKVPPSQNELNVGRASDCWGVTGIAVAAVVVLLVVALATAGCAAYEVPALSEEQIREIGPLATARKLLAARREAIEASAVR